MSEVTSGRIWTFPVAVGAVVGTVVLGLEHLNQPWSDVSSVGGWWLLLAFAAGAVAGDWRRGILAGVVSLTVANVAYYLSKWIFDSPLNPIGYDTPIYWILAAVPAGALLGWLGALSRSGRQKARVISVAAIAGMLATESFWYQVGDLVWALLLVVALSLPLLLLRGLAERVAGLVGTVAMAFVVYGAGELLLPALLSLR